MVIDKQDCLGLYAKGWIEGDANTILQALDETYVFDDPNVRSISKNGFTAYFTELLRTVSAHQKTLSAGGSSFMLPLMEITEIVTSDEGGLLTAWCWWSIPGTTIQGSGLIKVGNRGVLSERIAYYTRLKT